VCTPRNHGQVLPRRWVVERTFAWPGRNRRLSKDFEALPGTEDARLLPPPNSVRGAGG